MWSHKRPLSQLLAGAGAQVRKGLTLKIFVSIGFVWCWEIHCSWSWKRKDTIPNEKRLSDIPFIKKERRLRLKLEAQTLERGVMENISPVLRPNHGTSNFGLARFQNPCGPVTSLCLFPVCPLKKNLHHLVITRDFKEQKPRGWMRKVP